MKSVNKRHFCKHNVLFTFQHSKSCDDEICESEISVVSVSIIFNLKLAIPLDNRGSAMRTLLYFCRSIDYFFLNCVFSSVERLNVFYSNHFPILVKVEVIPSSTLDSTPLVGESRIYYKFDETKVDSCSYTEALIGMAMEQPNSSEFGVRTINEFLLEISRVSGCPLRRPDFLIPPKESKDLQRYKLRLEKHLISNLEDPGTNSNFLELHLRFLKLKAKEVEEENKLERKLVNEAFRNNKPKVAWGVIKSSIPDPLPTFVGTPSFNDFEEFFSDLYFDGSLFDPCCSYPVPIRPDAQSWRDHS